MAMLPMVEPWGWGYTFMHDASDRQPARRDTLDSQKSQNQNECPPETVLEDKERFQVFLNAPHFKPEDIRITEVDQTLVVTGECHEANPASSRRFVRKYSLPKEVDWSAMVCNMSEDGILSIVAPKRASKDERESSTIAQELRPIPHVSQSRKPKLLQDMGFFKNANA